jgi:hypothetical protein
MAPTPRRCRHRLGTGSRARGALQPLPSLLASQLIDSHRLWRQRRAYWLPRPVICSYRLTNLLAALATLQLGLYVCRLITGLMGGKIEVDSVKGAGSTFRFFIATQTPDDKGDIGKIVEVKPIIIEYPHVLVVEGPSRSRLTCAPRTPC